MAENNTQEVALLNKEWAIETITAIPATVVAHQTRVSKALAVGMNIRQAVVDNGAEVTREIDDRANQYLANCSKARKELEEARKPATQLMDDIKKMFTTEEAKLDPAKSSLLQEIQSMRNGYARKLQEEQDRIRREAERKAEIAKKQEQLAGYIREAIAIRLDTHIKDIKLKISNAFANIDLSNYEEKVAGLINMGTAFNTANNALGKLLQYPTPDLGPFDEVGWDQIRARVHGEYNFDEWFVQFSNEIAELRNRLIDRLPALKNELLEAAAAEQARLEAEKKAAEAKDEQAKQRAQQEALEAQQLQQRMEAEKIARIAEGEAEIHRVAQANRKRIEEEEAMRQQGAAAAALFTQAEEIGAVQASPEAWTGYEIKVLHQAGWVEIFQLWYSREGVKLGIEEMGGKKLDQMKKYCEDLAKKEDININSKYLKYETAIKAVNRKVKA